MLVNGVSVIRANISAAYGLVHIIDGLMDRQRLVESCPSLQQRLLSTDEGRRREAAKAAAELLQLAAASSNQHTISLRKVADGQQALLADSNEIGAVQQATDTESK